MIEGKRGRLNLYIIQQNRGELKDFSDLLSQFLLNIKIPVVDLWFAIHLKRNQLSCLLQSELRMRPSSVVWR
jgi:hypothetical protein